MNRATLSQRISSIQDDIQQLNSVLFAIDTTDIQQNPDNYEAQSINAALLAEQIACRLRHLVYVTTRARKEDYLLPAASLTDILVERHGNVIEITLPTLLPKRKRQSSAEYLLDSFGAAFSQYAKEHPMPRYEHCVVCFSSIYSREMPERRVRDYDNLEWKRFLDVAMSYLSSDGSGLLCDAYITTELGKTDCTRIFIMDSGHFSTWQKEHEKVLDSITDL